MTGTASPRVSRAVRAPGSAGMAARAPDPADFRSPLPVQRHALIPEAGPSLRAGPGPVVDRATPDRVGGAAPPARRAARPRMQDRNGKRDRG